jgi:hypothetical protein
MAQLFASAEASHDDHHAKPDRTNPRTIKIIKREEGMSTEKSISPIEIVLLTLLGVFSLCGVSGSFLVLTDLSSIWPIFGFLGMILAGLSSMAMLRFRNKSKPASAWLAMGIALWFIGLNMVGGGVSTTFMPGDDTFLTNLGFSMALCLAPGGFLALLGAIFYAYDYRRGRQDQTPTGAELVGLSEQARGWANKLQRATEYRTHIADLIRQYKGSALVNQLAPMRTRLNQWENHLRQLVNRLNEFEMNQVIQRDIRELPATTARLQAQLKGETNPQVRAQMEETLAGYQEHQRQLDSLVMVMRRTELEIDETLAEIGAIYSRLQLLDAKEIDRSRAKRLSADIEEQADRLNDLLSAMDEVYESSGVIE